MGEIYIQEKEEARIATQRTTRTAKGRNGTNNTKQNMNDAATIEHTIQKNITERRKTTQARMRAEEEGHREQQIVEEANKKGISQSKSRVSKRNNIAQNCACKQRNRSSNTNQNEHGPQHQHRSKKPHPSRFYNALLRPNIAI